MSSLNGIPKLLGTLLPKIAEPNLINSLHEMNQINNHLPGNRTGTNDRDLERTVGGEKLDCQPGDRSGAAGMLRVPHSMIMRAAGL